MGKCVGVCKLVGEVCIGCGRSVEEIKSTGYKKEIAQLKARVMELENSLHVAVKELCQTESFNTEHFDTLVDALNRKPPQSLETHDREVAARALDQWVNKNFHDAEHIAYSGAAVHRWAEKEAANLRAGGENE